MFFKSFVVTILTIQTAAFIFHISELEMNMHLLRLELSEIKKKIN